MPYPKASATAVMFCCRGRRANNWHRGFPTQDQQCRGETRQAITTVAKYKFISVTIMLLI